LTSNVVVRYLVRDDPAQAARAKAAINAGDVFAQAGWTLPTPCISAQPLDASAP